MLEGFIYLGVTVPFKGLVKGDVFTSIPVQYRQADCPEVLKMIIPLKNINEVRKQLKDKYSIYSLNNKAIVDFYKKKRR